MTDTKTTLPMETGHADITRFNALRHGVLSRYTVLPWEDADEYNALVAGLVWKPFFITTMIVAALLVWLGPTTMDWTRNLTAPKAAWALAIFWLSALMLGVQKFNPFIYFIF